MVLNKLLEAYKDLRMAKMNLTHKQKGTALGMLIGFASALAVIILGVRFNPFDFNTSVEIIERLRVATASMVLVCVFLMFSIGRLARHRFFTPDDIDGAGLTEGSVKAKLLQALLQNTLEQTMLAIVAYYSWALLMPGAWLSVIPLAALSFAIGRILFFLGYSSGASSRATGFALTFYPSALMLLCVIYRVATTL